jgi:hypothetical protein
MNSETCYSSFTFDHKITFKAIYSLLIWTKVKLFALTITTIIIIKVTLRMCGSEY